MKIPSNPQKGYSIRAKNSEMLRFMRAERIVSVIGGKLKQSPNGKTIVIDESNNEWKNVPQKVPLHLISKQPSYIPAIGSPPEEGYKRVFVEWGTLNDKMATNYDAYWDIAAETYFFAKAYLNTSGAFGISSWEIVTGADPFEHETPPWPIGGSIPNYAVYLLGYVYEFEGAFYIYNSGGGSLLLTQHITEIIPNTDYGGAGIGRMLSFTRQVY